MGTVYAGPFFLRLADDLSALPRILAFKSQGIRGHPDSKSLLPQGEQKVHICMGSCKQGDERG